GVNVADVELPEREDRQVENQRHHYGDHGIVDTGRQTYTEREVDVYDVFGVFEGVAEPDRRDDTAQGERQGETVLDEDKCARHRHRQHNHGLDDRLIVAALLLGGHVHPRRGQHQGQGPDHRKHRDDGERRGTQAPGTRAVRGLLDRLLLSYHAMDRRELLKAGE